MPRIDIDDLTPNEINEARWIAQGMARRAIVTGGQPVTILAPLSIPRSRQGIAIEKAST